MYTYVHTYVLVDQYVCTYNTHKFCNNDGGRGVNMYGGVVALNNLYQKDLHKDARTY